MVVLEWCLLMDCCVGVGLLGGLISLLLSRVWIEVWVMVMMDWIVFGVWV